MTKRTMPETLDGLIVDAVDASGRRYLFVDAGAWRSWAPGPCIVCGRELAVSEEFYMRNEASDGQEGSPIERALMALTYDVVCVPCARRDLPAGQPA